MNRRLSNEMLNSPSHPTRALIWIIISHLLNQSSSPTMFNPSLVSKVNETTRLEFDRINVSLNVCCCCFLGRWLTSWQKKLLFNLLMPCLKNFNFLGRGTVAEWSKVRENKWKPKIPDLSPSRFAYLWTRVQLVRKGILWTENKFEKS